MLEVAGLTKRYGERTAVDRLSFTLARGEFVGLLGPNGAGKTTTFLCLAGFVRPDAGTIAVEGKPLGPERGRTIALIPETPEVYPTLTVWEHLAFVARATRRPAGWEARADALLARFGLAGRRDALGETLSKGLRQKTLIAATVIAETPVLLIDEPMVGLDPLGQRELRELFLELRASGVAIVMSTHLIEQAESLCDRLVILCNGTAVANGTIEELRAAATGHSLEDIFLELTGSR